MPLPTHIQVCSRGRRLLAVFLCSMMSMVCGVAPAEEKSITGEPAWKSLFDGKTLKNWKSSDFGGEGEVAVKDGKIVMQQGSDMTGITWTGDALPKMNYEVSVMAQRIDGSDFFCGMTFEVNEDPCSLIIGGWGGGVVGISSLNGLDAANNETVRFESFNTGEWYKIRLRVSEVGLMAWIDDTQVVSVATKGKKLRFAVKSNRHALLEFPALRQLRD